MSDHDGARESLGAYVLGSLDAAERSRVDGHLAGCASCRDELASYAALPGLMSRLSTEEVLADRPAPPRSLLPGALAVVEAERAAGRERLRRWRGAALGVSALAAAGALAAGLVLPAALSSTPDRATTTTAIGRPLAATRPDGPDVPAAGRLELASRPWGTQLRLSLHDLPREGTFTAYAVDAHGQRTPAATWRATTSGNAEVTGACSLDPSSLARVDVVTGDGTRLLTTTT